MYVLGIDGGGTKTVGLLADKAGKVYARAEVGPTNQNGVDIHEVEKELLALFAFLKNQNQKAFSNLHTVFAGMSGVDRPEARALMEKIISNAIPNGASIVIDNDAVNALYSGTLGAPGIVQIAGTGSITFGINENGQRKRVGGWGYLIDDEGSGYDIGKDALHAIFKAFDGRGPSTSLTNKIKTHFGVAEVPELIKFIYEPGKSRSVISPLSKFVTEAAMDDDDVAKKIVGEASAKFVQSINSLRNQLFNDTIVKQVPVILVGGVFNQAELFIPEMEKQFEEIQTDVSLMKPNVEPVVGAVVAALRHAEVSIPNDFVEHIKMSLK